MRQSNLPHFSDRREREQRKNFSNAGANIFIALVRRCDFNEIDLDSNYETAEIDQMTVGVSSQCQYATESPLSSITVQHSTAQHSTAQHSTAQHSTAQHSTVQYSTVQYSTVQYSTVQYSTVQHSTDEWGNSNMPLTRVVLTF